MPISMLAAFWAVSILFIMSPGADWAYAITAGLHERAIAPAVSGLLIGHLLATLVVALGVGVLIASTPIALTILTVGGALYLLWLGIGMMRSPAMPSMGTTVQHSSWTHWTLKGVGVSGLNPKVFLLFMALLPQFVVPDAWLPVSAQMLVLGLIEILTCAVVYTLVAIGSKSVLRTRPKAARAVSQISGGIMTVIAVGLIVEQLFA